MKIYKNSASINLSLDEFLEMLEEEALDDVIGLLMDLDMTGSIKGDLDGEYVQYINADMSDIMDYMETSDYDYYAAIDDENVDAIMAALDNGGDPFDILGGLIYSNEDLKVKRIVERFFLADDSL